MPAWAPCASPLTVLAPTFCCTPFMERETEAQGLEPLHMFPCRGLSSLGATTFYHCRKAPQGPPEGWVVWAGTSTRTQSSADWPGHRCVGDGRGLAAWGLPGFGALESVTVSGGPPPAPKHPQWPPSYPAGPSPASWTQGSCGGSLTLRSISRLSSSPLGSRPVPTLHMHSSSSHVLSTN